MAPPPDDKSSGQSQRKRGFVRQLPKRIAAIEDIWAKLSGGSWDHLQLEALYERIREISENSKDLFTVPAQRERVLARGIPEFVHRL